MAIDRVLAKRNNLVGLSSLIDMRSV